MTRKPAAVAVPRLALLLGDEASLASLKDDLTAYPQGVTYAHFRHVLRTYLGKAAASPPSSKDSAAASGPDTVGSHSQSESPTSSVPGSSVNLVELAPTRHDSSFPTDDKRTSFSRQPSSSLLVEEGDVSREVDRARRMRTRYELAGRSASPVDPIKQLFNRIDVHNEQRVTWENLLNYVVAEASAASAGGRRGITSAADLYSFSRALRCPTKQQRDALRHRQQRKRKALAHTLTYKRYYRDTQEAQNSDDPATMHQRGVPRGAVREDEELALVRLLDGLDQNRAVLCVSTRNNSFALYSKETLERVFSAPPGMLADTVPTAVAYLAANDLFLTYSTDDRLLRGWLSLLSQSVATVTITPLLVEGFVRRIQTMPTQSPTYSAYAECVFLGDSSGHVLLVVTPHGRSGGIDFRVARTFRGLHTRSSGGLVDFCVYDTHLYSCGFDGRLVVTGLETRQSVELGSVSHEHLHSLVYVPSRRGIVAATSSTRQLLWWDAEAQSALPGVALDHAGYGNHAAAIVAVVYVQASDQLVSADYDGIVKVWDVMTSQCTQSFQSSRVPSSGDGSSGSGGTLQERSMGTAAKARSRSAKQSGGGSGGAGGLAGSAGRDMMMVTHNGLHSLSAGGAAGASAGQLGSAQCHALTYCTATQELMCGFVDSIVTWALRGHKNPFVCDAKEVFHDVAYDLRTCTFFLRSATRVSVWDAVHGVCRGVLDCATRRRGVVGITDIRSVCLDDLGSRLFVALGSGLVYAYSTLALAMDPAGEGTKYRTLYWSPSTAPTLSNKATPLVVEEMLFSSILRTWLAITSWGTLLVRTEASHRHIHFSTTLSVSSHPLTHLRVSEDLGLVAVVDTELTVFLFDMDAWSDPPVTRSLASYGNLVDLLFLDASPVLATVHTGGVCRCWSCPPAVERFELLGVLHHPRMAAAVAPVQVFSAATDGSVLRDGTASTGAAFGDVTRYASQQQRQQQQQQRANTAFGLPSMPSAAQALSNSPALHHNSPSPRQVNVVHVTRPDSAPLLLRTTHTLTATLRGQLHVHSAAEAGNRDLFSSSPLLHSSVEKKSRSTPAAASGALPPPLAHNNTATLRSSTFNSTAPGQTLTTLPRETTHRRGVVDILAPSPASNTPAMTIELDSNAVSVVVHEFTSVAYDGARHHLFLGDSHGVVHIYRMCEMLQLHCLPHCSYAARPAFSLTVTRRTCLHQGQEGGQAGSVISGNANVYPPLLRSVDVHTKRQERRVARSRCSSLASDGLALMPLPTPGGFADTVGNGGGVVCLRWLPDRGVLVTSGHDHQVWFLNSDGDRVAFLSGERVPPRPKSAATLPLSAGLLEAWEEHVDVLQEPFTLPPIPPIADDLDSAALTKSGRAATRCSCTHELRRRGEEGEEEEDNEATLQSFYTDGVPRAKLAATWGGDARTRDDAPGSFQSAAAKSSAPAMRRQRSARVLVDFLAPDSAKPSPSKEARTTGSEAGTRLAPISPWRDSSSSSSSGGSTSTAMPVLLDTEAPSLFLPASPPPSTTTPEPATQLDTFSPAASAALKSPPLVTHSAEAGSRDATARVEEARPHSPTPTPMARACAASSSGVLAVTPGASYASGRSMSCSPSHPDLALERQASITVPHALPLIVPAKPPPSVSSNAGNAALPGEVPSRAAVGEAYSAAARSAPPNAELPAAVTLEVSGHSLRRPVTGPGWGRTAEEATSAAPPGPAYPPTRAFPFCALGTRDNRPSPTFNRAALKSAPRVYHAAAAAGADGRRPPVAAAAADCGKVAAVAAADTWQHPSGFRPATAPPSMLAYSTAAEGDATLDLYARALQQRLRRPRV